MSRLVALTLAGVSALALSTLTAPVEQPAGESSSTLTSTAGSKRIGNWCC